MDYNHILSQLSNTIGIIGVILILIAYYLLSIGRWKSNTFIYQWLNFSGAWFILFSLFYHWNTASVLIEIAWIIISMLGMVRLFRARTE